MNILYQFNEKYAPFAGVSITSLLENNKLVPEIIVYILGEGLSEKSENLFIALAKKYNRNIVFIDTDKTIAQMIEWHIPAYRGSYAANLRLFLPLLLDESVQRVLYLDADTIIDGSVQDLYEMDMKEYAIAMALDSFGTRHKINIGLEIEEKYFNSGVVLFDLKKWREEDLSNRIVKHVGDSKVEYPSPDQDLLNVVCKGLIYCISPKWNLQPAHVVYSAKQYKRWYKDISYYEDSEIEDARKQAVIYHFFRYLGEFPWNKGNIHPDNELFDKYLDSSPWRDYEKQPAQLGFANKVERILYRILPKDLFLGVFSFFHNIYIEGKNEISVKK